MNNYDTTLDTLKRLKELFQDQELSDLSRCIAGCLIVDAEIARITGVPAASPACIAWGIDRADRIAASREAWAKQGEVE